ncbi:MAG: 2-dehydropantoate 2-reductase [Proteobacteria bacterium]|nr:2-dehydropantoate 2-reductase [Pseudomonadota bacterium]
MHFVVMGTGAMGGYMAARLAAAGNAVTCIARGPQLEALRTQGLRLESPLGDVEIRPIAAAADPGEVSQADAVLFTVKLGDAAAAARSLKPVLHADTAVITFQNGIDAPDIVAAEIGEMHVLPGSANVAGADVPRPGVVRHLGRYARFVFGERDGRKSERAVGIAKAFTDAGIELHLSEDIVTELWSKFVLLTAASGTITATRSPLGSVRGDPQIKETLRAAMVETAAVGRAAGVDLPATIVDDYMALLETFPADQKSSMLQDLEAGRKLELSWLSGSVCRLGRAHGIATPVHDTLYAVLKPHEHGRFEGS